MPVKKPPHVGGVIRREVIKPLEWAALHWLAKIIRNYRDIQRLNRHMFGGRLAPRVLPMIAWRLKKGPLGREKRAEIVFAPILRRLFLPVTTKVGILDYALRMGRSEEPQQLRQAWLKFRGCRAGVLRTMRHILG